MTLTAWLGLIPAVALVLAFLYLPGLALLRGVFRLPWAASVLFAAPLGAGFLAVFTYLFGLVGVPWNLWSVLALLALLLGAVFLGYFLLAKTGAGSGAAPSSVHANNTLAGSPAGISPAALLWSGVGVITFAIIYGSVVLPSIGAPGQIPTVGDAPYHLQGVRIILETGSASPLGPFAELYPGLSYVPFYPTLWHSLVVPVAAFYPIVEATNAAAIAVGLILWPASLSALAVSFRPTSPLIGLIAPTLALPIVLMPAIEVFGFAVYPLALSVVLLGPTLGLLVFLMRAPSLRLWVIFLIAALGVTAAQPTTGLIVAAFVGVWGLVQIVFLVVSFSRRGRPLPAAALAVATLGGLAAVLILLPRVAFVQGLNSRPTESLTYQQAVTHFLLGPTYMLQGTRVMWIILILAIIGFLLSIKKTATLVVALSAVLLFVLYVAAAGPDSYLRIFTSPWWKDASRFAIFLLVPLLVFAAVAISDGLRFALKWANQNRLVETSVAVIIVVFIVLIWAARPALLFPETKAEFITATYSRSGDGPIGLTEDEVLLISELDDLVEEGTVVIGDPDSGTGWVSVVSHADQFQGMRSPESVDQTYVGLHFDEILTNPKVCEILEKNDVTAFIQSDSPSSEYAARYVGYNRVDTRVGFNLIHEVGGARLYAITACD